MARDDELAYGDVRRWASPYSVVAARLLAERLRRLQGIGTRVAEYHRKGGPKMLRNQPAPLPDNSTGEAEK